MSTLSGQTINSTYQGLLKLDDSTTGITSSYQQIQDGLGNNTDVLIKQGGIKTLTQMGQENTISGEYFGVGIGTTSTTPGVALYALPDRYSFIPFYDNGFYSYSAITVFVSATNGGTSEIHQFALYDTQWVSPLGIMPNNKIGDTIAPNFSTTAGFQTFTFSSPVSFPQGLNYVVYIAQNLTSPGAQITSRLRVAAQTISNSYQYSNFLGFTLNDAGDGYINAYGTRAVTSSFPVFQLGVGSQPYFPSSYTPAELIAGRLLVTPNAGQPGFILHRIM